MPELTHPNGQTTFYLDDNFTDPWKPCETVLIQHGFARHAAFWYHWIPVLAPHYRVIRRDARGHGRSSSPGASYDYSTETILSEIADTLDQLGLDKVHLLGESTGGIFAEAFAFKHPHRLYSLTICSSPMYLPPAAQTNLAFGHADWPTACRELGAKGWAKRLAMLLGTDQIPDKAYLEWWVDQVALCGGLPEHAELLAKIDSRPFVAQIRVPMLILAPANSAMTTVEDQKGLRDQVRGAKMVVVHGKGHEIYVDKAEECQMAFLDFLKGLQYDVPA